MCNQQDHGNIHLESIFVHRQLCLKIWFSSWEALTLNPKYDREACDRRGNLISKDLYKDTRNAKGSFYWY
jgi:hypothetical protein